ncbi:sulfotransferase [Nannocystaceae bacterium ST9]
MSKRIVLHVGLHKTATTFLQDRVFPELPGVAFVHPLHYPQASDGPIERFMLELFFRNPACIDLDRHRAAIASWLDRVEAQTVLISSEAIVGWPIENHSNLANNSELLHAVFPAAQVILVVRRQDKWLESAYAQLLKAGFSTSIERYVNWSPRTRSFEGYNVGLYKGPNLDARDLDWAAFDRHYRRRFGEQAVLTLPFELFADDAPAFLRAIYEFLAVDEGPQPDTRERVNERWSGVTAGLAKLVNKVPMPIKRAIRDRVGNEWHPASVFARTIEPLLPKRKSSFVPEPIARALLELHRDDNRALAERIDRDLGRWGYY